tara:strand:+ start:493 stop:675 length:183 start_codon:yes stop_codon:yes gene_type:complete
MIRILKYSIAGIEEVYRIKFEDNNKPITILDPTSRELAINCNGVTIASFLDLPISYIEII